MFDTSDLALCLVDRVAADRDDDDKVWRSAIREAIASNVPIEHVACRANVSVEEILAIMSETRTTAA
ncbi:hypothetical protein [Catellatospora sp. NPDC049609]|uniref:hypothetical protein n=1 Tax=Catellatospora sp. NPDC049609 TaxID=3155505 RepID=UPI003441A1B7